MRGKRGVIGIGNQKATNTNGYDFGGLVSQTPTGMVGNDSRIAEHKSFGSFSQMSWYNTYANIFSGTGLTDPKSCSMSSDGYHLYVANYYSIAHWKLSIPYDISTRTFQYYWTAPCGGNSSHVWSPDGKWLFVGSWSHDKFFAYYTSTPFYMKDPGDNYATTICNEYNSRRNKWKSVYGTSTGYGDDLEGIEFGRRIYYDENGDISSYGDLGTRVFLLDGGKDKVMWWDLTTAWDPTTMTNANNGWSYGTSVDSYMGDMYWSSDGTKLFLNGSNTNDLFRWDLSTAWDLTGTVTYYGNWAVGDHRGMCFNKTGNASTEGKYYFGGTGSGTVQMWTLDTPYDITGTKTLHSTTRGTGDSSDINGLSWDGDGKQLAIAQEGDDHVYIWRFSDPWDWDSYIESYQYDCEQPGIEMYHVEGCVWGGDDYKTLFVLDGNSTAAYRKGVYRCHFEVPGDGRTWFTGVNSVNAYNDAFQSIQWSTDGRKLFIQDDSDDKIYEYKLKDWAPDYFINQFSLDYITSGSWSGSNPCGFGITPDGKTLIWNDGVWDTISMYKLGTPWSMSDIQVPTGNYAEFGNYALETYPADLFMSRDGRMVLMTGTTNEELHEWRRHYD